MKKQLLLIVFALTSLCSFSQININDFEDAKIYFDGLFSEESRLDEYGNVVIDMGSASAGRCYFRITDVTLKMEEKPEEPGCADICPPRVLIHFKCRKSSCIGDPAIQLGLKGSGVIDFGNVKRGKKAFEYLKAFKQFILNDLSLQINNKVK